MERFLQFLLLADPNIRYVVVGTMLLTSTAAMIGCFALLKKKALLGDVTAHAVLPGICIAFMLTGIKHPFYITLGAFSAGWLGLILVDLLAKSPKLKVDIATSLVLSIFFGIGTFLLSIIQNSTNVAQLGLQNYIFGKAAALLTEDLQLLAFLGSFVLISLLIFFKEFKLIAFDKAFASAIYLPVKGLEFTFTSLLVLTIVVGIQAVGIVLMAAMLITPAAAARFWTDQLNKMIALAAMFGSIAGWLGSLLSYLLPNMPTGPVIVLVATTIAYISFFFAPQKGLLAKTFKQWTYRKKILTENLLKIFYELGEREEDFYKKRTREELMEYRFIPYRQLNHGLAVLEKNSLIYKKNDCWRLTGAGQLEGKEIVIKHRLWETYLARYIHKKLDVTHENAEIIEHILTPEITYDLSCLLKKTNQSSS